MCEIKGEMQCETEIYEIVNRDKDNVIRNGKDETRQKGNQTKQKFN